MPGHLSRRSFVKNSAAAITAFCIADRKTCHKALAGDRGFQAKLAICNETFQDWPFERAFALAAECGYQGLEIAPFTISDYVTDIPAKGRKEIRGQAEKAGLQIVGLHWLLAKTKGFHLTSPDREVRRKTVRYLGELTQFCADLGGDLLVFGSPKQRDLLPEVSRRQGLEYAAEVIGETLPVLDKLDVRLAIEPLSPKTTNFLRTADEAMELIKRVDSPRCRLILDCLAMAGESKPQADLIRRHRSHLVHVHANDPNGMGPGFGELDFKPIFRALHDIEFDGWVSVEVFDYKPGPERLARESIEYMRKCLAEAR